MAASNVTNLKILGAVFRIATTGDTGEIERLAATVEVKLHEFGLRDIGDITPAVRTLLLVALSLAHELERERALRAGRGTESPATTVASSERLSSSQTIKLHQYSDLDVQRVRNLLAGIGPLGSTRVRSRRK